MQVNFGQFKSGSDVIDFHYRLNWHVYFLFFKAEEHQSQVNTQYREIFVPVLLFPLQPRCQRANLRLGELRCLKLSLL